VRGLQKEPAFLELYAHVWSELEKGLETAQQAAPLAPHAGAHTAEVAA
jgi:hypothetical protein